MPNFNENLMGMKKYLLLILLICFSFEMKAQVYQPMLGEINDTIKWSLSISYPRNDYSYRLIESYGDTVCNGFHYKKVLNHPKFIWREDKAQQKVFIKFGLSNTDEAMVYDFSNHLIHDTLAIGFIRTYLYDTFTIEKYVIDSVSELNILGGNRKEIFLHRMGERQYNFKYNHLRWVESVGSIWAHDSTAINSSPIYFDDKDCCFTTDVYCQYINESHNYSDLITTADCIGIKKPFTGIEFKIYPNPIRRYFTIAKNTDEMYYFDLYNQLGQIKYHMQLINNSNYISIPKIDYGLYFYRITDSNNKLIKSDKLIFKNY